MALESFAQGKATVYHYSTTEGLSDKRILSIIKDSEGFIWTGTWTGLNRFDGHNFLTFKSNPGDNSTLNTNRIEEIVDDKKGNLWIRAYDKLVYRFDKKTHRFASLSELLGDKRFDKLHIRRIVSGSSGIWLRSEKDGMYLLRQTGNSNSFTRFSVQSKSRHRLISNDITFSYQDQLGNMWVGTTLGLSILKKVNSFFESICPKELQGISVTNIVEGSNTLYAATKDGYLILINRSFNRIRRIKITNGVVNSMHLSIKRDKIFFTTSVGELVSVDENGNLNLLTKDSDNSGYYAVFQDHTGHLWVESESDGILRIDPQTKRTINVPLKSKAIYKAFIRNTLFLEDKQGGLWVNFRDVGLFFYDKQAETLDLFNINKSNSEINATISVNTLLYDQQGVLWLGTEGGGLKKVVIQSGQFSHLTPNPGSTSAYSNEVRGLLADHDNRVWLGNRAGAVVLYNDSGNLTYPSTRYFGDNQGVYCFLKDRKGRLWFGTKAGGLFKVDDPLSSKKFQVRQYLPVSKDRTSINSRSIYSLFEDRKGRIWVGSYDKGLIQIDESGQGVKFKTVQNSFKTYPAGNYNRIRCLNQDRKGNIWIGTTDGLLIFNPDNADPANYQFSIYRKERNNISSLGGNDVHFIFKDSESSMWVLTSSGGLNKAVEGEGGKRLSFLNFSMKSGLPSDFLLSCTEDAHKNLWIATQNGISRYSLKNNRFQNFNAPYGLEDISFSEASCSSSSDGRILFGTKTGLLSFNPTAVALAKVSAEIVFTNLQVNGENILPAVNPLLNYDINNTAEIVLPHDQNTLSIDFSLLDYRNEGREDVYTRLLGLDDTWRRNEGQTRITYAKLPPGEYQFQVKSDNSVLYNAISQKTLKITILSPWWKRWWAYTIYALLILILLIAARRIALTMIRLKQRVEVERRVSDLKQRFFTQVSHELRTPLSLIVNPSEEILENENLSVQGSAYIRVVVKNARRMARLVNQLLDLGKVESGQATLKVTEVDVTEFCQNVTAYFKELTEKRSLKIHVQADTPALKLWVDADKFDIVIYNLLANAIKFSPDGGKIDVRISRSEDSNVLRIEVIDKGIGVDNKDLEDIFKLYYQASIPGTAFPKGTGIGLALSRELVELHGGIIYALPNLPSGLIVVIEMKLGNHHFSAINAQFTDSYVRTDYDSVGGEEKISVLEDEVIERTEQLPLVLIVEDNEDLRLFLELKLSANYRVLTAFDGEDGLNKALEFSPDLILSDIMMPRMDGIELLTHLKNRELTCHIPVVLLTARQSIESQIESINYGADFYITKPFDLGLLEAALKKLVSQRQQFFQSLTADQTTVESESMEPPITAADRAFLQKVIKIVEEKLDDIEFNVDDVADAIGMSRSAFFKKFKSLTNTAPVEFVRETRLKKARELFDEGEDNISTVAFAVGFNHPTYFSTCFKNQFQVSPRAYVKSKKGTNNKT